MIFFSSNQSFFRARKVNNSYKSEGQLPQDPDIYDLKLYVGQY